jgi:hypothetical protein
MSPCHVSDCTPFHRSEPMVRAPGAFQVVATLPLPASTPLT